MANTDRQRRKQASGRQEILTAAWEQIQEGGPGSLSLRAVAQAVGLTAPGVYRYFPSKADLVTALIIDGFGSLHRSQEAALTQSREKPWSQRMMDLGLAYRDWALANPAAFILIFGNPIPGYVPPWQETMPEAAKSLQPLLALLLDGARTEEVSLALPTPVSEALMGPLKAWSAVVHQVPPEALYHGFSIASRVQGLMIQELGHQLPPFFPDGRELYITELRRMIRDLEPGPKVP